MRFKLSTVIALFAGFACGGNARAIDSFHATGNMAAARYSANAQLLPDGKVLIAGGRGDAGPTTTAEIYDPATGLFKPTGTMVGSFLLRSSAKLPGGKILIASGLGTSPTAAAEVYDPATNTFAATGSLNVARWYATATSLPNGEVLIAGGADHTNRAIASAELYDPVAGTFASTGTMGTTRIGHTSTLLPSGNVLIAGGTDLANGGSSAEVYDVASGTFTSTGNMTTTAIGRYDALAAPLPDGRILIAGGESDTDYVLGAEIFDETTGTFTATGSLSSVREAATIATLADGKILIAGGLDPTNIDNSIATAELYDPATGMFSAAASMVVARQDATATVLPGGLVLIAGGDDLDGIPLLSADLYVANVIFHGAFESP